MQSVCNKKPGWKSGASLARRVKYEVTMEKVIEEQIHRCGYKMDSDVCELYLGRRGLKDVSDLSRFRLLKYLWLNHNKISNVNFLGNNFRLAELYLNSNELSDITGSLKHLTSLHTLMLNDNHLTNLQATMKELKGMTNLRILNVTQKEREEAFQLFHPHRTAVIQSLGFGRRTDSVLSSRAAAQSSIGHRSSKRNRAITRNSNRNNTITFEDKVLLRGYQRSVMQFTLFDWNKILLSKLDHSEEKFADEPQLITVTFR
ncbi:leucine-rich repeat-containing protein 72 isoform X3 [Eleutherodactylus coqui]|uniref:leucine-rich repeat-containing protein 72 isoform X3 n=1 Tax=Eleutherodactylus coqui TaxID=57060 RepID=UPI003462B549